jgi:murein DD-endopeptidase MepM/ murein hydrolase activator NlpD
MIPSALLAIAVVAAPVHAASVHVAPAAARPGDAVLVRITGPEPTGGTVAGRPLAFWRERGGWSAIVGLPMETPVGTSKVEIERRGGREEGALEVVEPGFPSRQIRGVPERFVEPPPDVKRRIDDDRAAFAAAYARPFGPPLFRGRFAWPRSAPVSGRFGDQRTLNGEKQTVHYGTDLKGARGAPVSASNDGEVALVRDAYLSGRTVLIAHGAGIFTAYFHLDRIDVRAGQRVRRGQRIGRIGSTGRATGPHLHWSARVGDLFVDPESLLAIDFARGTAPARAPRLPAAPAPADVPPDAPPPPMPGTGGAVSGTAPALPR